MGKGSKPTVGYWYRPLIHSGIGVGPIDAFLEYRGGDKTAWQGELTSSGTISINAPNLWGGEKDQGGIVGDVDVMFGEATQEPNAYLLANLGDQIPAWRGMTTLVFKGGKYGAMNPYPQKSSYKIRKIKQGWDTDPCWYPEKAEILLRGAAPAPLLDDVFAITTYTGDGSTNRAISGVDLSAGGVSWFKRRDATGPHAFCYSIDGSTVHQLNPASLDEGTVVGIDFVVGGTSLDSAAFNAIGGSYVNWTFQRAPRFLDIIEFTGNGGVQTIQHNLGTAPGLIIVKKTGGGGANTAHWLCWHKDLGAGFYLQLDGAGEATAAPFCWNNTEPTASAFTVGAASDAVHVNEAGKSYVAFVFAHDATDEGVIKAFSYVGQSAVPFTVGMGIAPQFFIGIPSNDLQNRYVYDQVRQPGYTGNDLAIEVGGTAAEIDSLPDIFSLEGTGIEFHVSGHRLNVNTTSVYGVALGYGTIAPVTGSDLIGMNPAHILYYARTHSAIGREPTGNINDDSYLAAADRLYAEGFGLCTSYDPAAESLEEFEQRICRVIGGSVSRSVVDGQWYLDLARGDYVLEDLPILTDDDILEFREQPSTLDGVVNSLSVKFFDPDRKEDIITPPVQALALIDAFGTIHQTNEYPEIPTAAMASRVADRDLRATVTPTRAFDLTTTRKTYAWRPSQYFRLQAPKRGIADMVCILGEKQSGTLRSGAIKIKATQDIYNLPSATFVEVEPGIDPTPPQIPTAITLQRAFEAPYMQVVQRLSRADLSVLPDDVGYLGAVGAEPGYGRDYTLTVAPDGGDYAVEGSGEWCPTALVVEAATYGDTAFTLTDGRRLDQVLVGTAALWDDELCRVDAINVETGAIVLGRGCGDTVEQEHASGSRLWFFDDYLATDTTEYTDGESVSVKLLTNTGSAQLSPGAATSMLVTFDARQARPYPPAGLRINGERSLDTVVGDVTVTATHRDRVLQVDQLVDCEAASIGPEPGTTYTCRWYLNGVLEQTDSGLTNPTATYSPTDVGLVRMELESVRDGITSWQMQVREFYVGDPLLDETGAAIVTETDDIILME